MFDPLSPDEHRCPRCGRSHRGERHHRDWIRHYHLWLSERAIHLALLGSLREEPQLSERAREILSAYAVLYPTVPNQDNVLGPTRLFFSTYLESIWLLQVVMAAAMLPRDDAWSATIEPMIRESATLIASFDEGWSNRQAWNDTALLAAGQWLGDETLLIQGLDGPHGVRVLLRHGVTAGGLWFEGENYHFFALRGLLLAAELLRAGGIDLYGESEAGAALAAMYRAPLDTVLPDLTLPARGDAPFAVSLRQPRFAELWEIGWARTGDARIAGILAELYGADLAPADDAGFADLAEQELNVPAAGLERTRLGWKALAWMVPEPPPAAGDWRGGSTLLAAAGFAVLRPGERRYVGLETGGRRGGHGHPDLLNLSLFWDQPVLLDLGTGSYVTPSLHWYRSALAHNAPLAAGAGQSGRCGWCDAFDTRDGWGWCRAVAADLFGPGTEAQRTVIAGPDYAIDVVQVTVPSGVAVDLPIHPVASQTLECGAGEPTVLTPRGAPGHEHGYDALREVRRLASPPRRLMLASGTQEVQLVTTPRASEELFVAVAPGPPDLHVTDGGLRPFLVRRAWGPGRWVHAYADAGRVAEVVAAPSGTITVTLEGGLTESIELDRRGARVRDRTGRSIRLEGLRAPPAMRQRSAIPPPIVRGVLRSRLPSLERWERAVPPATVVVLDGRHYRRAERPYDPAHPFRARVALCATGRTLCFLVDVEKRNLYFRPAGAEDPALDNEAPDIHSDGVQCYLGADSWAGYVAVPDPHTDGVLVRAVRGTAADTARVHGRWRRTARGYAVLLAVETARRWRAGETVPVALTVNEMYAHRERRAGQLALAGDAGWVYLRGDREPPHAVLLLEAP